MLRAEALAHANICTSGRWLAATTSGQDKYVPVLVQLVTPDAVEGLGEHVALWKSEKAKILLTYPNP